MRAAPRQSVRLRLKGSSPAGPSSKVVTLRRGPCPPARVARTGQGETKRETGSLCVDHWDAVTSSTGGHNSRPRPRVPPRGQHPKSGPDPASLPFVFASCLD